MPTPKVEELTSPLRPLAVAVFRRRSVAELLACRVLRETSRGLDLVAGPSSRLLVTSECASAQSVPLAAEAWRRKMTSSSRWCKWKCGVKC
jgi:hypothetical protein